MAEDMVITGFAFGWPWLLLIIPVPWLLRLALSESPARDLQALKVPWYKAVVGGGAGWMKRPVLAVAAAFVWLLLVVAAARPQWVGEIETLPITGRDLLLAVDISGSMDTQDMFWNKRAVNRLVVVKKVAGENTDNGRNHHAARAGVQVGKGGRRNGQQANGKERQPH